MTAIPTATANPYGMAQYPVKTPTGSTLNLMTGEEADYYESSRDRYMTFHKFPSVSDLADLDRLLMLETMVHRWGVYLGQGWDYMETMIDFNTVQKNMKDFSGEVRLLKQSMGIDKVGRDRNKGEQVSDYLQTLLRRAKEFGYHRNKQYEVAVTKMFELISLVKMLDRCDAREREDLDISEFKILDWIRDDVIPTFEKVDEDFKKNQSIWVQDV